MVPTLAPGPGLRYMVPTLALIDVECTDDPVVPH
jgi:hypothetical protein